MWHLGNLRLVFVFCCVFAASPLLAQKKKGNTAKSEKMEQEAFYLFSEAEKYFLLENYSKSYKLFLECLELKPNESSVYYKLAELDALTENMDRAAEHIKKAISINPDNEYYYVLAADIFTQKGDLNSAAKNYQKLIANIPGNEQYYIDLGGLYIYLERPKEALQAYEKAEAALGITEETTFQKQTIYRKENNLKGVELAGKMLVEANPGKERYVLLLSDALLQSGAPEKAIACLENFSAQYETTFTPLVLSSLYEEEGQKQKAWESAEIAMKSPTLGVDHKINWIKKHLRPFQLEQNYYQSNLEEFNSLLGFLAVLKREYGKDIKVLGLETEMQAISASTTSSLEAYKKVIETNPNSFVAWNNALILLLKEGKSEEALGLGEEALEYFPNRYKLYFYMGKAAYQLKRFEDSNLYLEQLLRINKTPSELAEVLAIQASNAIELKHQAEGWQLFEKALLTDSKNESVLNNYSYYLSLEENRLKKAIEITKLLVGINGGKAAYKDRLGWLYYKNGMYSDAKVVLEEAVSLKKDCASCWNHYGDVLFQLGEIEEAVITWQKALALDPQIENIELKIKDKKLYE